MKLRNLKLVVVLLCCGTVMAARSYLEVAPRDRAATGSGASGTGSSGIGVEASPQPREFAGRWGARAIVDHKRADSAQVGSFRAPDSGLVCVTPRGDDPSSNADSDAGSISGSIAGSISGSISGTAPESIGSAERVSAPTQRTEEPVRRSSRAKVISIHVESAAVTTGSATRGLGAAHEACSAGNAGQESEPVRVLELPLDEPALMVPGSWGETLGS